MKSLIKHIEDLLVLGLLCGLTVFLFSIITVLSWQGDGFDLMEVSILSILSGVYFFLIIIAVNVIGLNKYIRSVLQAGRSPLRKIVQIAIVLFVSLCVYAAVDSIYYIADSSVSKEYAEALMSLAARSGGTLDHDSLNDFARLPFALQNGIVTVFFAMFGALVSLPFIKRDGILLKL